MKDNIPLHATKVTLEFDKIRGTFFIWPTKVDMRVVEGNVQSRPSSQARYQWSGLGNCGEEATFEKAVTAARDFVRGLIKKTE